jgi:WD40 repeat protein
MTTHHYATLEGHPEAITVLAIRPDGRILASVGRNAVQVWTLPDSEALFTLSEQAISVAFSPDNQHLVGHLHQRGPRSEKHLEVCIKIWSLPRGELLASRIIRVERPTPNKYLKIALASSVLSPNGQFIAVGYSYNPVIHVRSIAADQPYAQLENHTHGTVGMAFSSDAELFAGVGTDGVVRVWHLPERVIIHQLERTDGETGFDETIVGFSPDRQFLSMTSLIAGTVHVWRLLDGVLVCCINNLHDWLTSLTDQLFVYVNADDGLQMWSLSENRVVLTSEKSVKDMTALCVFPDNSALSIGMKDGSIQLWNVRQCHYE